MAQLAARARPAPSQGSSATSYLAMLDSVLVASAVAAPGFGVSVQELRHSAARFGIGEPHASRLLVDYVTSLLDSNPTDNERAHLLSWQAQLSKR